MVYLDYAATTPLLSEAQHAMRVAESQFFANASALHTPGHLALQKVEDCRKLLAEIIGAKPEEIIFTSGSTESNNTIINTFKGCEIIASPLEHHSILAPAKLYRGHLSPKLYSFMLANNETGDFFDLPQFTEVSAEPSAYEITEKPPKSHQNSAPRTLAEMMERKTPWGKSLVTDRRPAYLHSDLTQALGKIPIDVNKLGLDYATFSAHKIGGPLGVGAMYVRTGVPFVPFMLGGLQENGRRGGTYNTVGIAGFMAALEHLRSQNTPQLFDTKTRSLRDSLARQILAKIPGSSLNTDIQNSLPNILNVSFRAAEGESIQLYLDAEGIIVSTGSACAAGNTEPSHVLMAKTGDAEVAHSSIRFSFGLDNTEKDVKKVMQVLPRIIKRLQGMSTIK